jgi:hypothetical protein
MLENHPLQAPITMREFQFFESIIEKRNFVFRKIIHLKFCDKTKRKIGAHYRVEC